MKARWLSLIRRTAPVSVYSRPFCVQPVTVPFRMASTATPILSLLRSTGPMPISVISSRLSDEALESASKAGGVREVLKQRADVIVITVRGTIHVAILSDMVQHVDVRHRREVCALLALVAAMTHTPRVFTSSRFINTESLLRAALSDKMSLFDCTDAIHRILHRYPTLFRIERSGAVHLTAGKEGASAVAAPKVPGGFSAPKSVSPKRDMLIAAIRHGVPESHYVSLSAWLSGAPSFWRSLPLPDLLTRLNDLVSCDPAAADIRHFGDTAESIFVRVLNRQDDGFSVEEEKRKGAFTHQSTLFAVGHRVMNALQEYVKEKPEHLVSMLNGLSMASVCEILQSRNVIVPLEDLFCDGSAAPVGGELLILLFDRFRHLCDVSFSSGSVRLWSALPPAEQPSTLTWETTPLPLVLRAFLSELTELPQTLAQLHAALPSLLQCQLAELYGTDGSHANCPLDPLVTVRIFISQHSMFMFVSGEDGLAYTPQLLNSQRRRKHAKLSDREKAELVYQSLPKSGAVDLITFVGHDIGRLLPFESKTITGSFLSRFPTHFKFFSPFASHRAVVGRSASSPPPSSLLNPSFSSIDDLIKFIALHAVGGVAESTIMNHLSKEGRAWVKRVGGVSQLAEQLPQWFDVRRDKYNSGASLITYSPAQSEDDLRQETGSLKLVCNDRRYSVDDDVEGQWSEEFEE